MASFANGLKMKICLSIVFLLILIMPAQFTLASTLTLEQQRKEFLYIEKLIKKGKSTQFHKRVALIKNYPLYSKLQYQWLKKNLRQTDRIKNFLKEYSQTRYASLLNYRWQIYLAKHKRWKQFLLQYEDETDTTLQCYFYWAKYKTGSKKEALLGARQLWVVGKSQPDECDPLFKVLKNSKYFAEDLLWQRFAAAVKNKKTGLAKYIKRSMSRENKKTADIWLKIHSNPGLIKKQALLDKNNKQSGLIFAHAIDRMANNNYKLAIKIWDARKNNFTIDKARFNQLEQRLAMSLAYRRESGAYQRLAQLEGADQVTKEWRVRTALLEQNWEHVERSIADLSQETQKKEKWQYWLARALEKTGKLKASGYIYDKLSTDRSFYGYLSAEKLKKDYQLSDHPVRMSTEMLEKFKQTLAFRIVAELLALDRPSEAKRQWWFSIKQLDKKDILIAAKYAQELNWTQTAIFTIAKAKYWDDVSLRFPIEYRKQVENNAKQQQLHPAVIYGLIRRESAFNEKAQSRAGARGLMQIMPRTGKQIAKELKEKLGHKKNLFKPDLNIKYGAYYYKQLLKQFNGRYALATAGYNAGSHRVKKWLPKGKAIDADIWVETIPLKETRAYVSAVLTYALIYQKQLGLTGLTMKDFSQQVSPS
ncbi:MAG: lytic transglycosylase domain-containing protein [Methylococcales symbiont of Hymedesmia sp. n. MRB-2018]|nr:MAG: lytic transglycosylase domain-containing protein [Methylococcales symbiont of Hymedesmia sp. n. MRB-2018]